MRTINKLVLILLLIAFVSCNNQNETIVLSGRYKGKNIFVQNPLIGTDTIAKQFCIEKIIINDKEVADKPLSSAIEIDLAHLQIKIGDPVKVTIIHRKDCQPQILNKPFDE
jgi:hypothetical protein